MLWILLSDRLCVLYRVHALVLFCVIPSVYYWYCAVIFLHPCPPGHAATPSSMSKSRLGRVSTMPPSPPNGNAHQARVGGGATATGRQSSVGRQQLQTSMGRRTGQIGARTKTRAGNLGQLTLPANDRLMAIPSAAGSMSDVAESPYFMGLWVCFLPHPL